MNSSLPSSLHFIKNIPYQLKIFPAIALFLISISSPKFLNALSIIVSIVILPLFPLYPPFSLHTANFTLLKLLSSAFTMIFLSQLANTNFLLLYFFLDLSAALDTIDHNILLSRLTSNFGVSGSALSLISSYLSNRSQSVSIQSHLSPSAPISTGVPQGSVLGPLLFCLYTTPLTYLFSNSPVSYHFYADDTQLYISFSSSDSLSHLSILSSTLDSVFDWFTSNRLSVNPSKTEFLLIGTPQQHSKLTSSTLTFQGTSLSTVSSCCNLGVILDNDLSFI